MMILVLLLFCFFVTLQGFQNLGSVWRGSHALKGAKYLKSHAVPKTFVHTAQSPLCAESGATGDEDSKLWKSVLSLNQDLDEAVGEVLDAIVGSDSGEYSDYNVGVFYSSSIYEASAFKYSNIFDQFKERLPNMKIVVGCTTGMYVYACVF